MTFATNTEMRTKLVEELRRVLTERSDHDIAEPDQREAVIDDLSTAIGTWATEVVDTAFQRLVPTMHRLVRMAPHPGVTTDSARKFLRDMGHPDPYVERPNNAARVRQLTPELLAETSRNYTAEQNDLPLFNDMPKTSQAEWVDFAKAVLAKLGPVSTIPEETDD